MQEDRGINISQHEDAFGRRNSKQHGAGCWSAIVIVLRRIDYQPVDSVFVILSLLELI